MTQPTPAPASALPHASQAIDLVKQRWLFLGISAVLLVPGLVFMGLNMVKTPTHTPLKLGIDFVGGTLVDYTLTTPPTSSTVESLTQAFVAVGLKEVTVQPQQGVLQQSTQKAVKTPELLHLVSVRLPATTDETLAQAEATATKALPSLVRVQKSAIGPTMATELLQNGLLAMGLAFLMIVAYLAYRFRWDYALAAMVALAHDTLFVLGAFATLGALFGTEINSLFITGILTVIGFSVHDTIVVFDRLRENSRLYFAKRLPFATIANMSVNQTLARSINTSLTAVLALLALYVLGGASTRDFVLVMLLGIIAGTYSSIFVASLSLVLWQPKQPVNATPSAEATPLPA
jgi:preprotein translocase subunit SecF